MTLMSRGARLVIGSLVLVLAACTAPPTAGGGPAPGTTGSSWAEVYDAIDGVTGEARTEKLVELAKADGGVVRNYSSMNGDEGAALTDAFTQKYGIQVDFYRASAQAIIQRVTEEVRAGYDNGADVIASNGTELVVFDREGILEPMRDSPVVAEYPPEAVERGGAWVWSYVNYYTPVWNTTLVDASEAPRDWMQALTAFGNGRCALEAKSYDWLATMVRYLGETQGMSEDQALQTVRQAASGCRAAIAGNSLVTNLVASGEYDIVVGSYHISARQRQADGAPVEWFAPPATLFARPNGVGVSATAPNPAAALLFAEFVLSAEGAGVIASFGRTVAHPAVSEGAIDPGYEIYPVDLDAIIDDADKWQRLYDELNGLTTGGCVEGC
jgi:iron(III) transport system substrate-binding protein